MKSTLTTLLLLAAIACTKTMHPLPTVPVTLQEPEGISFYSTGIGGQTTEDELRRYCRDVLGDDSSFMTIHYFPQSAATQKFADGDSFATMPSFKYVDGAPWPEGHHKRQPPLASIEIGLSDAAVLETTTPQTLKQLDMSGDIVFPAWPEDKKSREAKRRYDSARSFHFDQGIIDGRGRALAMKCDTCSLWTVFDASALASLYDSMETHHQEELWITQKVMYAAMDLATDYPSPFWKDKQWAHHDSLIYKFGQAWHRRNLFYEQKNQSIK